MFIEVHILQSFAPSNLNRDDTGNPKSSDFGGVRRARISSQCLKRAIRQHPSFAAATQVDLGVRTRWITRLFIKPLSEAGKPLDQAQAVANAFAIQYSKMDKSHTSVLLYVSGTEISFAVQKMLSNWDAIIASIADGKSPVIDEIAKELFKTIKDRTSAPDIALFGRMLAENPELNIDAGCQVAHAISTHRVNMEMDFYTAVDDLSTDEETGAGMMGVIPFNSACFYRYARLDWKQLVKNLNGDVSLATKTVTGFVQASLQAVPTGKQNGFAAQSAPDFVLGVTRQDGQSWSLVNAFEKPVRAEREGGLLRPSIAALDTYWERLVKVYGALQLTPIVLALDPNAPLTSLKDHRVPSKEIFIARLLSTLPQEG